VFLDPVVLEASACQPTAVLKLPVVLLLSAASPRNVLKYLLSQPSSQTARADGESASHAKARASALRSLATTVSGEWLVEFKDRVLVFI
jgi:hypothetical protein